MADAMMMFLGEAHGVNWYWAQPGEFENPGVYYWDGVKNVLCVPHLAAAPEAPAKASAVDERDRKDAERYRFIRNAARSDPHLPFQSLLAYACESLDEAIDDAMEEEARAALAQKGGAA